MTPHPPGQPRRVTAGEIADLLDQLHHPTLIATPEAVLAFFGLKADLLTRIADDVGTDEARQVAAEARAEAAELRTGSEVPTSAAMRVSRSALRSKNASTASGVALRVGWWSWSSRSAISPGVARRGCHGG